NPNASAYSASKAGVIALTKSVAKELVHDGIIVNCITPAAVESPMFAQMTKEHINWMLSKIPMNRFGKAQEIAALIAWLCSDDVTFSTGAAFDITGGRSTYEIRKELECPHAPTLFRLGHSRSWRSSV